MCFITKDSKLKIASKDIECYKIVKTVYKDYCISLYQEFKYDYNKKYSKKSKLTLFLKWLFNINIESGGYHSFIYPVFGSQMKCIIPKGSLYIIDRVRGEYCSTSIIIKTII